MTVLLTAIWPSFANIPNHIPDSQGISTSGMCGFVLYFLLQLPFLCIPYTKVWHRQNLSETSPRFMYPTNATRFNTFSLSRASSLPSSSWPCLVAHCTMLAAPSATALSSPKARL